MTKHFHCNLCDQRSGKCNATFICSFKEMRTRRLRKWRSFTRAWCSRACAGHCQGGGKLTFDRKHTIQPTVAELIQVLDVHDGLEWNVELVSLTDFLVFQSWVKENESWEKATQLWVQRQPFQITAIQSLTTIPRWAGISHLPSSATENVKLQEVPGWRPSVVWQTSERGIRYQGKSTILSIKKPSTARYFGFGEQGGSYFKDKTFLDYFSE